MVLTDPSSLLYSQNMGQVLGLVSRTFSINVLLSPKKVLFSMTRNVLAFVIRLFLASNARTTLQI